LALTTKGTDIDYIDIGPLNAGELAGKISSTAESLVGSVANTSALYGAADGMREGGPGADDSQDGGSRHKKSLPAQMRRTQKGGDTREDSEARSRLLWPVSEASAAARLGPDPPREGRKIDSKPNGVGLWPGSADKYADAAPPTFDGIYGTQSGIGPRGAGTCGAYVKAKRIPTTAPPDAK